MMTLGTVAKIKFVDGDALAFACLMKVIGYNVYTERDDPMTLTIERIPGILVTAFDAADSVNPFDCFDVLPEPDYPDEVTQPIDPAVIAALASEQETEPLFPLKKVS